MNTLSALDSQLLNAITAKDLAQVEQLLAAGANPNSQQDEQTAFQLVPHGAREIQCALIVAGAQDPSLKHALVWVISTGHVEAVKQLLRLGTDINVKTYSGTPIQCAANGGHVEIVELLIAAGADLDVSSGFATALTGAIANGHFDIALKLIAAGANPNLVAEYSQVTPLAQAAVQGSTPIVKALIQAGATVNHVILHITINQAAIRKSAVASMQSAFQALEKMGGLMESLEQVEDEATVPAALMGEIESSITTIETRSKLENDAAPEPEATADTSALILAARCGHAESVTALLSAEANPDFKDGDGCTAYDWAVRNEQSHVLIALRNAGIESSKTSPEEHLINAAEQGELNALQHWISQGANLNTGDTRRLTRHKTPLILAATAGHSAIVKALIEAGADLNLGDAGENPQPISKSLLYHMGADAAGLVSMGYQLNRTALMAAAAAGHVAIVAMLIQHNADRQQRDLLGQTALLIASENGHTEIVAMLLDARMPIDDRDHQQETALLLALGSEHLSVANLLLDRGSDVNAQSKSGRTPLMWVAEKNYLDLIPRLIQLGANVNTKNRNDESALYYADLFDHHQAVALLKQHGAIEQPQKSWDNEDADDEDERWGEEIEQPDFSEAAQNPTFQAVVTELGKRCGSEPIASETTGLFYIHINSKHQAEIDIETMQAEFLTQGCFVYEPGQRHGKTTELAVLPTTDKYAVLALHQTNGGNYGIGPGYVIDWLRQLEENQPFVLTCIAHDTLKGRFLTPIADPEALAESMYEFCPDIVDQGCGEVEFLAEGLQTSDNLYFWWD